MMKRPCCCAIFVFVLYVPGCQRQEDVPTAVPAQQPTDTTIVRERDKKDASTIEITDVLDALQMNIWKARVNEDADKRVRRVSLSIKQKDRDSQTVLTLELPDEEPGTL